MPSRSPSPGAIKQREYQRAYRRRLKRGLMCLLGSASPDLVEDLINAGLLPQEEASNKTSLGAAVVKAASLWVRNRGGKNGC